MWNEFAEENHWTTKDISPYHDQEEKTDFFQMDIDVGSQRSFHQINLGINTAE
jgi:hypothetical protein